MSTTSPRRTVPARVTRRLELRRSGAAGTHRPRPHRGGRSTERRNAIAEQLNAR